MRAFRLLALALAGLLVSAPALAQAPSSATFERQLEAQLSKLLLQLGSRRYSQRQRASKQLEALTRTLVESLQKGARSEDLEIRRRSVALLRTLRDSATTVDDRVREWMLRLPEVNFFRDAEREAIRQFLDDVGERGRNALVEMLLEPRLDDAVRYNIVSVMVAVRGRFRFGEARLIEGLKAPQRPVRRFAAEGLSAMRHTAGLPGILELTRTAESVEFVAAMEAAMVLGTDATAAALWERAGQRTLRNYDRSRLGIALIYHRDPRGGALLLEMMSNDSYETRKEALKAWDDILPGELAEAFKPGDPLERRRAALAAIAAWWDARQKELGTPAWDERRRKLLPTSLRPHAFDKQTK